jgi:DNA (cytosine-5)-methyltransferase 1
MKINLLDLFSGIGGFHLGLSQAGFKVNSYYSEIDKYAIKTYNYNFKNSTYVGSITNIQRDRLPKRIHGITFGSPCQDFSLAGKRKGLDGDRSSLIGEAINLISELKPDFFIWENVKGTFSSNNSEDFWAIIKAFTDIGGYRLEWQLLNTSWFLPQNRERIYLVGYTPNKNRGQIFPIGEVSKENNNTNDFLTTNTIHSRYTADSTGSYIEESYKVSSATKKAEVIGALRSIDRRNKGKKRKLGQQLEVRKDGNSNTLTSVEKDNYVVGYSRDKKGKITNYHEKDEANTLHSSSGGGGNTDQYIAGTLRSFKADAGFREIKSGNAATITGNLPFEGAIANSTSIRRLTPVECERLQGFPDNWTLAKNNSDTQRYKMIGNAVTVDVVKAVGERIIKTLY